jgi:hypothetical protein
MQEVQLLEKRYLTACLWRIVCLPYFPKQIGWTRFKKYRKPNQTKEGWNCHSIFLSTNNAFCFVSRKHPCLFVFEGNIDQHRWQTPYYAERGKKVERGNGSKRGGLDGQRRHGGRCQGKKFRRETLDPRKPLEAVRGRLLWQSKLEGRLKKLRPEYPHYQKSNQARRQEKLWASQDKGKLSHSNDWCAKSGSNTTSSTETDTPLKRKT